VGVIETDRGTIVVELYEKDAPQHVANFKKLASQGFYNGLTFHRIVPGFVIQGGDPNSKDDTLENDGAGGPGYTVPAEIKRNHERGSLAAARTSDDVNPARASSGSQFYICLNDIPQLDGQYTVYGKVVEGMDVVDAISLLPRISSNDPRLASQPAEKVVMKSVRVERR
jgi:cyclophilin family peptidyl-prolyl cis-trans isomerase